MSLIKRIQNFSFQNNLWQKGSKIVIGVSGGPDSVCLLDIFLKLQKKYALEILIANVNYGLRGKDSEKDEQFVRKLAENYGIKIEVLKFSKAKLWKNLQLSFSKLPSENELRDIRYAFFEKVRQENKFDLIAVAHNRDDQAETVLLHLIRGAGLRGLAGIQPRRNHLIRPLLNTSRQEILQHLALARQPFRTDKTNLKSAYLRNKIRNKLIPSLEKDFNPSIKEVLADTATTLGRDELFLQIQAEKRYRQGYFSSARRLLSLDPALQARVVRLAIQQTTGSQENISFSQSHEIIRALQSTKSKHQTIKFRGLKFVRKGDTVTLLSI
ncbi:tRNA lysidine(34) synthetase TilS [Patescibacteria group bacterium]|nr:MAG: tRNA lysidine(34) synthetase TilS [Patescibacteria group bacterium]